MTVWKKVPEMGSQYLHDLCQGMKRCYGLVLVDSETDFDQVSADIYEPPLNYKFSTAANWILLKQINVQYKYSIKYI